MPRKSKLHLLWPRIQPVTSGEVKYGKYNTHQQRTRSLNKETTDRHLSIKHHHSVHNQQSCREHMLHSRQHEHSGKPNCENRCPRRVNVSCCDHAMGSGACNTHNLRHTIFMYILSKKQDKMRWLRKLAGHYIKTKIY